MSPGEKEMSRRRKQNARFGKSESDNVANVGESTMENVETVENSENDTVDASMPQRAAIKTELIKPVEHPDVIITPDTNVHAKFKNSEGDILYPKMVATSPNGGLAMVGALRITKKMTNADGTEKEVTEDYIDDEGKPGKRAVELDENEKFLLIFNNGFDTRVRLMVRNELAGELEGPEKQINAMVRNFAKAKKIDEVAARQLVRKAFPELFV